MNKSFILKLTLLASASFAVAAEPGNLIRALADNNRAVIPLLAPTEAPKIDGVVDAAEWRRSSRFAGFIKHDPERLLVADRTGLVNFATDGENLFIAVRSSTPNNDPGGGLAAAATLHDGEVYNDDSVEVTLNPDTAPGKTFHLIVNSRGVVFDRMVTYAPANADVGWNCPDIKVGTVVKSGWWELELKIPFASVGAPKQSLKVNVARNWQGLGASALVPTTNHCDREKMIALSWRKDAPAVQMNELGAVGGGDWKVKLDLTSTPAGKSYKLGALLRMLAWSMVDGKNTCKETLGFFEEKELDQPGALSGNFLAPSRDLCSLNVLATDAASGEVVFARTLLARKGAEAGNIPATVDFDMTGAGGGQCFHYPTLNRAAVEISPLGALNIKDLSVTMGGKSFNAKKELSKYRAMVEVPPREGTYSADVVFALADGTKKEFKSAFSLTKRNFPWENNQYGKAKTILPPFTPIAADGDRLDVLLRSYRVNAAGLLDSLVSLDRELLAAPLRYEMVCDGKRLTFSGAPASIKVTDQGYSAKIAAKVSAANGVAIVTEGLLEYDGFLWNKLSLEGVTGKNLERLTLVIPLKDKECPLFHVVSDTIRGNPAGLLPAGDGVVWSGDKLKRATPFGQRYIHPQLVPYIWLGAEKRGLSWFVDSSYGMKLDTEKPSLRITREGGTLRLEIDLINRPAKLEEGHPLAFGLHATPVKPQDKAMRRLFQSYAPGGVKGMTTVLDLSSLQSGYHNNWAHFPYKNDYKLFEAVCALANTGKGYAEFDAARKEWDGKYLPDLKKLFSQFPDPDFDKQTSYDWWLRCRDFQIKNVMKPIARPVLGFKYSDPTLETYLDDTPNYFKSEWCSQPTGYTGALRAFLVPSYMDYVVHGYRQQLERGLKGIYLDDMFVICDGNPDTVAQVDDEGFAHSRLGLLAMRELVKRIAVMQHELKLEPRFLQIHMTNALIVPAFSFATSLLDWEDKYGESDFQDRFPPDFIRAESLGTQVGAAAVVLDGIFRQTTDTKPWDSGKFEFLNRTQMAMMLPHGISTWQRAMPPNQGFHPPTLYRVFSTISNFETWADDCEFVPYYEDDKAVTGAPKGVLLSSYRRGGKTLIVLGNLGDEAKMTLSLDRAKLKLPPDAKIYNAETRQELVGGTLTLPRRDFAMLLVGAPNVLTLAPGQ